MSTTNRAAARTKGLRLAARVATVGGIAVAALGLVEARAASAASASHAVATSDVSSTTPQASDDAKPLPLENLTRPAAGNCGCSPCWGPPAPPSKDLTRGRARARPLARLARNTRRRTSTKRPRGER